MRSRLASAADRASAAVAAVAASAAVAMLAACAAPPPLSDAEIEAVCVRLAPPAGAFRQEATVTIDSPFLHGEYVAVLVGQRDPVAGVARLQLFPELGGKLLDVLAADQRVEAMIPMTGSRLSGRPTDGARSEPLLRMFAISLLESVWVPAAARVQAGWKTADGVCLELEPRHGEDSCRLLVSDAGGARRFAIAWAGARWELRIGADGAVEVEADGFALRARIETSTLLEALPAAVHDFPEP